MDSDVVVLAGISVACLLLTKVRNHKGKLCILCGCVIIRKGEIIVF